MTFTFDSDFEKDSVLELMDKIEGCKDKNITIYFNSTGGIVSYAELLIEYINTSKKKIKVVAYYYIESCAFDFITKIRCKVEIKDTCLIMVHMSKPIIGDKLVEKKDRYRYKKKETQDHFREIDKVNEKYCEYYRKLGIPENLMEEIEAGENVVIPLDLMREIIKRK